jgi:hypothetical protein
MPRLGPQREPNPPSRMHLAALPHEQKFSQRPKPFLADLTHIPHLERSINTRLETQVAKQTRAARLTHKYETENLQGHHVVATAASSLSLPRHPLRTARASPSPPHYQGQGISSFVAKST